MPRRTTDEQLPGRTRRPAAGPHHRGPEVAAPRAGPGHLATRSSSARSIGAGVGLWLLEVTAGTIGFLWPNLQGGFGGTVKIGTFDEISPQNASLPIDRGLPGLLLRGARVRDPDRHRAAAVHRRATDTTGDGDRGQRPRRCTSAARTSAASRTRASRTSGSSAPATARATTAWGSRPLGPQYGPAPRSMDRFAATVDGDGALTHRHRQDHARARCRSRSASPASSRRAPRPAASDRLPVIRRRRPRGDR